MPMFRHEGEIHYFAHVPKCGGSSVEKYLESRFGLMAFHEPGVSAPPWYLQWTKASAQHVAWSDLCRIFPVDWIASSFAVVRHPVDRLASAFNMRLGLGQLPAGIGLEEFLGKYQRRRAFDPFLFDNHLRPQSEIVPPKATVFQLENGLEQVVAYLDERFGPAAASEEVAHANKRREKPGFETVTARLSQGAVRLVEEIYGEDFERFGYAFDPERPVALVSPGKVGAGRAAKRRLDRLVWLARARASELKMRGKMA